MNAQQALALANQKIDQLQSLADTQAAIIAKKNDEIDALKAELSECMAGGHDYSDALCADCEDGGTLAVQIESDVNRAPAARVAGVDSGSGSRLR